MKHGELSGCVAQSRHSYLFIIDEGGDDTQQYGDYLSARVRARSYTTMFRNAGPRIGSKHAGGRDDGRQMRAVFVALGEPSTLSQRSRTRDSRMHL